MRYKSKVGGPAAVMICLILAACSSVQSSTPSTGSTSQGGKNLKITGVLADTADAYFVTLECGGNAAAKQLGVHLTWEGSASPDVTPEENTLNSVILTHPNGVILDPFSPTGFLAPVKQLMNSGTPVVLVDSALSKSTAYKAYYTDNYAAGEVLAKPLAKLLGDHGLVGIISSTAGDPVEGPRYMGFEAALRKIAPGIKTLPAQYADVDSSTAASITTSLILGHPGLSAIYATDGPSAAGAANAIRAAGKQGKIKLIAFDAEPVEVQGLKHGDYVGLVAQAPYLEGFDAVQALVSYLRGGHGSAVHPSASYYTQTPAMFIDRANVNSSAARKFLYLGQC
jgi:ribose transport system substrate-binding protein